MIFIGFLIYGCTIVTKWDRSTDEFFMIRNVFLAFLTLIILLFYIIIFVKLYRRLKENYPQYYVKHKQILMTLFSIITFSLITRTFFNVLYCFPEFNNFMQE